MRTAVILAIGAGVMASVCCSCQTTNPKWAPRSAPRKIAIDTSAKPEGPYAKPGFVTFEKDGRLWVFIAGSPELASYRKGVEPAKSVTRIGAGPGGMTLRAVDAQTLDAYLDRGI